MAKLIVSDEFSRLTFGGVIWVEEKCIKMQDSREEGEKEERELAAAIRERLRESGAMDRISAGVRSGTESEILIFKISIFSPYL